MSRAFSGMSKSRKRGITAAILIITIIGLVVLGPMMFSQFTDNYPHWYGHKAGNYWEYDYYSPGDWFETSAANQQYMQIVIHEQPHNAHDVQVYVDESYTVNFGAYILPEYVASIDIKDAMDEKPQFVTEYFQPGGQYDTLRKSEIEVSTYSGVSWYDGDSNLGIQSVTFNVKKPLSEPWLFMVPVGFGSVVYQQVDYRFFVIYTDYHPPQPTIITQTTYNNDTRMLTVQWNEGEDIDGDFDHYVLEYADNSYFTDANVTRVNERMWQTDTLEDGMWAFRVKCIDVWGYESSWSNTAYEEVWTWVEEPGPTDPDPTDPDPTDPDPTDPTEPWIPSIPGLPPKIDILGFEVDTVIIIILLAMILIVGIAIVVIQLRKPRQAAYYGGYGYGY